MSLRAILEFEAKQFQMQRKKLEAERQFVTILDKKLPLWLVDLGVTTLPPSSGATIVLCNRILEAYEPCKNKTGIKLETVEMAAFKTFLRKLTLCCPAYGDRLYQFEAYDRSSLVYCGYCNDYGSARNPMSLKQAGEHLAFYHRDSFWMRGMLRRTPPGQPVYDGMCYVCQIPVLVDAVREEIKSGVKCKGCCQRWCFRCMDSHVWLGPEQMAGGVIRKGDAPFC